jgi:hypothetical protein
VSEPSPILLQQTVIGMGGGGGGQDRTFCSFNAIVKPQELCSSVSTL